MFRSLVYREYRRFFIAQWVSLTGGWMHHTAQSWLVYRMTRDPLHLGLVSFASLIPILALGVYAGAVADRLDRRRVVQATQGAAAVLCAALAAAALGGWVRLWHVYVFSVLMGVVNAFDIPARQVLIGELVRPEDRSNAIALNSTIVNGARMLGAPAAGLAVGLWGEGACFLLNALSYVPVIVALSTLDGPPPSLLPSRTVWEEIRGGAAYVLREPPIRALLVLLGVVSAAAMPYNVLMPVFAEDILGSGSAGLGLLTGAAGAGAVVGALALASRRPSAGLDRVVLRAAALFPIALAAFAVSRSLPFSCAAVALAGMGLLMQMSGINALLQELSAGEYRGRVMGFYTLMFLGVAPFGSLAAGLLASALGASGTVLAGACVCAVAAWATRTLPAAGRPRPAPASLELHVAS